MLGAPLAELPGANAKLRRSLRQPLAAVQQPLHRLRLELPREAPSGSPLRHPSLLGCLVSLANPPAPGGKSKPKETNRQIGPLFRRWLNQKTLGLPLLTELEFVSTNENAILIGSDTQLKQFARDHLNYNGGKGLDFVARMHGQYVIGEAKFLTDFGGHQNGQF